MLAIDYRGRGQSEYDPNPANYNVVDRSSRDLLAVLTALEIEPAVFVGTSRGGILAMLLATVRPAAIAGVVLNDIGPVIETKGLVRIKSYVGRLPQPKSFEDGAEILRRLFCAQFPQLGSDDWIMFARRTFKEKDGSLKPRYDPKLADVLKGIDMERSLPPLWKEFDALASCPVMVIRGANSDILSAETVEAMRVRRPDIVTCSKFPIKAMRRCSVRATSSNGSANLWRVARHDRSRTSGGIAPGVDPRSPQDIPTVRFRDVALQCPRKTPAGNPPGARRDQPCWSAQLSCHPRCAGRGT